MSTQKLKSVFLVLSLLLTIAGALYGYRVLIFNKKLHSGFLEQDKLTFPYFLEMGENPAYTLFLGDLNGLNRNSYLRLLSLVRNPKENSFRDSIIIVPSLMPEKSAAHISMVDRESFYNQISNNKGVVLVDNFCTKNWKRISLKSLYKSSSLTPGPFCFSEPESRGLNTLIKTYRIKNVKIFYDATGYEDFIANFVEFLKENNINYSFVPNGDVALHS